VVIGRAALPVLVGAASLAVRAGWKLLQSRLAQAPAAPAPKTQQPIVVPQPRTEIAPHRAKRTIHIRSSWAVNNGGVWQQGSSEHTIELDD
jgi:hypothetical protein